GDAFMNRYDRRAELAPRDIVARAIDAELKASGDEYVLLDITHKSAAFIKKRFPNIYVRLLEVGLDMTKEPIPVAPAAHYFCGGVVTDGEGKTALPGLYAIGEVANTDFHGANRLASNSLLEACAFAHYAAAAIKTDPVRAWPRARRAYCAVDWGSRSMKDPDAGAMVTHNWDEVRRVMTNYVGIVRSEARLALAAKRLAMAAAEIGGLVERFVPTKNVAELANILLLGGLITASARSRKESRGLHYMLDYPKKRTMFKKPTIVSRY
ncbi:MAG: FAD-binding protein, partial [Elusimicrobiota bacterium]